MVSSILLVIDTFLICNLIKTIIGRNVFKVTKKDILFFVINVAVYLVRGVFRDELESTVIGSTVLFLIPLILYTTLNTVIYKLNMVENILVVTITIVATIITQSISLITVRGVTEIAGIKLTEDMYENIIQSGYMLLMLTIILGLGNKMSRLFMFIYKHIISTKNKLLSNIKMCIAGSITMIVIVAGVFAANKFGIDSRMTLLLIIVSLLCLMLVITVYYESLVNTCRVREIAQRNAFLEEQAQADKLHKDFIQTMNAFGHNYNNLTQTISFFVNCDDLDITDVRTSLQDIAAWSQENKISYKLKYIGLPDITVASVMSIKLEYANSIGVVLDVNFKGETPVNLNRKTFIDILNVVVNNAIEAAYYAESKVVKVGLWFGEDKFTMTVTNDYLINSYSDKVLKYGESHGIGLESIYSLGLDYVNISHTAVDNKFSITVEVKNTR